MTQIVVLAGGEATGIYPMTKTVPKSLIPINNIPFISYQIKLFKKNNVSEVVFCLGKFHHQIIQYLDDNSNFGMSIKYSIENESNLLGTLGALKNAYNLLEDDFFLIYGDSYLDIDYQKIYQIFLKSKKSGLMTICKNNDKSIQNNICYKNNKIIKYGKNKSNEFNYIDYGLSIFKKNILEMFEINKKLDLAELNKKLIDKNDFFACEIDEFFYEVGSFSGIKKLEDYLKS